MERRGRLGVGEESVRCCCCFKSFVLCCFDMFTIVYVFLFTLFSFAGVLNRRGAFVVGVFVDVCLFWYDR